MKCKLLKISIESSLYLKHDLAQKRILIWKRNKLNTHTIFSAIFHAVRYSKNISKPLNITPDISIEAENETSAIGGGNTPTFDAKKLYSYVQLGVWKKNVKYKFETHVSIINASSYLNNDESSIFCQLPMSLLVTRLTLKQLRIVANLHDIHISNRVSLQNAQNILEFHTCNSDCCSFGSIFKLVLSHADQERIRYQHLSSSQKERQSQNISKYRSTAAYKESRKQSNYKFRHQESKFLPPMVSSNLEHQIISGFCADTSSNSFVESGCAVCGKLTQYSDLVNISDVKNIKILTADGVTRLERKKIMILFLKPKAQF